MKEYGVDYTFIPEIDEIYPEGFQSEVSLQSLSLNYEGDGRPGHFQGVCTVVSVLFNLFQPRIAVFGEKDFQQLLIVEQMVEDLKFPIKILRGKTIREKHGLAMSSRNNLLSIEHRESAKAIYETLLTAKELTANVDDCEEIKKLCKEKLLSLAGLEIAYFDIVDEENLQTLKQLNPRARALTAVKYQGVRLIDNMKLFD